MPKNTTTFRAAMAIPPHRRRGENPFTGRVGAKPLRTAAARHSKLASRPDLDPFSSCRRRSLLAAARRRIPAKIHVNTSLGLHDCNIYQEGLGGVWCDKRAMSFDRHLRLACMVTLWYVCRKNLTLVTWHKLSSAQHLEKVLKILVYGIFRCCDKPQRSLFD